MILKPVMPHLADPQRRLLALALFSTFTGNTTLLASVANLIVVQKSRHEVEITFWESLRVGLLPIVTGVIWLSWFGR